MTQTQQQMTEQQLAEIEARATAATAGPWCTDAWEIYQGTEYVPGISEWIGETCRGATTPEQDRADAAFVAAARADVPALVAAVRRLRAELEPYEVLNPQQCPKGLHADWLVDSENTHACPWCRIAELERPSVEARRNEIRSSYTELISQAEQDRDIEGAATLALQLRESEAKWAAEDAT
jgi:hypothetical protein